jgi:hypothetical protein
MLSAALTLALLAVPPCAPDQTPLETYLEIDRTVYVVQVCRSAVDGSLFVDGEVSGWFAADGYQEANENNDTCRRGTVTAALEWAAGDEKIGDYVVFRPWLEGQVCVQAINCPGKGCY